MLYVIMLYFYKFIFIKLKKISLENYFSLKILKIHMRSLSLSKCQNAINLWHFGIFYGILANFIKLKYKINLYIVTY